MSDSTARVQSIEAVKRFKIALVKFTETAGVALASAEGGLQRTLLWLQTEQLQHWTDQLRKRTELLARANEALRQKKNFKDASGRTPYAMDEEKAVAIAKRRLEEAEQKIQAVRKYARRLEKEIGNYKGAVQRFASTVESDIPRATEKLERLHAQLDAYVSLQAPEAAAAIAAGSESSDQGPFAGEEVPSMARPEPDAAREKGASESAPEKGASDKGASEKGASEKGASEKDASEKGASKHGASKAGASEGATEGASEGKSERVSKDVSAGRPESGAEPGSAR
jgi:hypothetical protein